MTSAMLLSKSILKIAGLKLIVARAVRLSEKLRKTDSKLCYETNGERTDQRALLSFGCIWDVG